VKVNEDGVAFPGSGVNLGVGFNGLAFFVRFWGVEEEFDRARSF
jgi:hypothetical protein